MNEKTEFIRSKAIEANPSITTLQFGCFVKVLGHEAVIHARDEDMIFRAMTGNGHTNFILSSEKIKSGDIEIIGRPIRLADVLLIYGETKSGFPWKDLETINQEQIKSIMYITSNWDLKNDDLTKQSEETIDFIYNLLNS